MCLSTLATTSPEARGRGRPRRARWFQLYVFTDRGSAASSWPERRPSGYEALVVTVDLPLFGVRERELRTRSSRADEWPALPPPGVGGAMTPTAFAALVDPDLRW